MKKTRGLVSKIIRFSAVDGPGNRLVMFLQGCNFRCINCHNPHTIGQCTACGQCIATCPAGALKLEKAPETEPTSMGGESFETIQIHFTEAICQGCDRCLAVCSASSNPRTRWMEVTEVQELIRQVSPFLSGITVSGGEATLQLAFLRELFQAVKADPVLKGLTTFLDSNGTLSLAGWNELLPVMDGAMIDLKALDPAIHQQLTGTDNTRVLQSIPYLFRHNRLYEVRLLIIPGYNAELEQAYATASYLAEVCPTTRIRLIPFRIHGVKSVYQHIQPPTAELMAMLQQVYQQHGFQQVSIT